MKQYKHLSYASSLCGNCSEVCPVHINLHNMLLYNRRDSVQSGHSSTSERLAWFAWEKGMLNRKTMNSASPSMKNRLYNWFFKKSWGKRRDMLNIVPKSFNEQWKEKRGKAKSQNLKK